MKNDIQKLIDLCFDIGTTISTPGEFRDGKFYNLTTLTITEKADWIAEQLRKNGFDTYPCGSKWGVLRD